MTTMISGVVTSPRVMRQMPRLLRAAGSTVRHVLGFSTARRGRAVAAEGGRHGSCGDRRDDPVATVLALVRTAARRGGDAVAQPAKPAGSRLAALVCRRRRDSRPRGAAGRSSEPRGGSAVRIEVGGRDGGRSCGQDPVPRPRRGHRYHAGGHSGHRSATGASLRGGVARRSARQSARSPGRGPGHVARHGQGCTRSAGSRAAGCRLAGWGDRAGCPPTRVLPGRARGAVRRRSRQLDRPVGVLRPRRRAGLRADRRGRPGRALHGPPAREYGARSSPGAGAGCQTAGARPSAPWPWPLSCFSRCGCSRLPHRPNT